MLHRLITNDPSIQTLPFWLGTMPVPRPPRKEWNDNPLFQVVDRDYVQKLYEARPETRILHPMQADKPEECRWIIEQGMWSTFFAGATDAPNYTQWAMEADTQPYYEYYRKVLSVVSNGDTRPWILKDPGHIFCIDALMAVFPDACIVQTHREPVTGIASTSNMLWSMRKDLEPDLTMRDVGDLVLKTWAPGLKKMEESRRNYDEKQFCDIHMRETQRDPMGTMQRIYEHFDMPLSEETLSAWRDELERDPNQEHSIGKYDPADFGINESTIAEPIGAYAERYEKVRKAAGL